jgi:uncharacterized LabA/DUF88 family protein
MPLRTAILIDGGFFIQKFRKLEPNNAYDARRVAQQAHRFALMHLVDSKTKEKDHLYRIFYYDCPPLEKKLHNPISGQCINFAQSDEAIFRRELHSELLKKRKLALRLGRIAPDVIWQFKGSIANDLMKKKKTIEQVTSDDVIPTFRQKGVDMRIGLDITSLALKKQVEKIVLISGDSDFVPAAKFARREGIDFVLDAMWHKIADDLFEHIDGLRSTFSNPKIRLRKSDIG